MDSVPCHRKIVISSRNTGKTNERHQAPFCLSSLSIASGLVRADNSKNTVFMIFMIYFKPLSQLDAHEAIQIAKTLLQLTLHSTEWKCSHICWWCIVSGWLQSDQASKAWTWCLHTRGEKLSFSGRGKWVLQNAEHRTASEHSIEGPTQSLYPRMPREFQFQVSNRVSLELFTGGSVQALFIARRF